MPIKKKKKKIATSNVIVMLVRYRGGIVAMGTMSATRNSKIE